MLTLYVARNAILSDDVASTWPRQFSGAFLHDYDTLAVAWLPNRVEIAHQAGQADRPAQFARVKFTSPLGALAAISNASSEKSKISVSS